MDEIKEEIDERNFNQFQTEIKREQYEELSNDSFAKEDLDCQGNETCLIESILHSELTQDTYTDIIALDGSNGTCYKLRIQVSSSGDNECMNENVIKYEEDNINNDGLLSKVKQEYDHQGDYIDTSLKEESEFGDDQEHRDIVGHFEQKWIICDNDAKKLEQYSQGVATDSLNDLTNNTSVKRMIAAQPTNPVKSVPVKLEVKASENLDVIQSVHSKSEISKFECGTGEFEAYDDSDLRDVTDSNNSLRPFQCHLCDYRAMQKSHLRYHIDAVHFRMKNFKCLLCDYSASRRASVNLHVKRIHLKKKVYKCRICDYRSNSASDNRDHMKSVHLECSKFECQFCGYGTRSKSILTVHVNSVHLKLKNFKCHICDFATSRDLSLKAHFETVHLKQKNFKCSLCNFKSYAKSYVTKHMKRVHLKGKN